MLATYTIIFTITIQMSTEYRIITTLRHSDKHWTPVTVHGEIVRSDDFQFLVSIKRRVQKMKGDVWVWRHHCGGSIIHPRKVLTAAHCYDAENVYKYYQKLRAVAGSLVSDIVHTGEVTDTADQQWRKIKSIKTHENYHFPLGDISIIFVNPPFMGGRVINCLTPEIIPYENFTNHCLTVGYGRSVIRNVTNDLLFAKIHVIDDRNCSDLWEMDMHSFVCSDSVIVEAMAEDSGNALICSGGNAFEDLTRRTSSGLLLGIVSGRNFDNTTLYTRVETYQRWIDNADFNGSFSKGLSIAVQIIFIICFVIKFVCTCFDCIYLYIVKCLPV